MRLNKAVLFASVLKSKYSPQSSHNSNNICEEISKGKHPLDCNGGCGEADGQMKKAEKETH